MVLLSGVEAGERVDLRHDGPGIDLRLVELLNVGFGNALLLVRCVEDGGPVLRAFVRSLAVELRRVMRNGEVDLKQFAERNTGRIEGDPDRLGMAGAAGADDFIVRGQPAAAGVSGYYFGNTLNVPEHCVDAPET